MEISAYGLSCLRSRTGGPTFCAVPSELSVVARKRQEYGVFSGTSGSSQRESAIEVPK